MVRAGEWRVQREIESAARQAGLELETIPDGHFLSTPEEFNRHAKGRKQLGLEYFYRELRQKHRVLLDEDGAPAGGKWNLDSQNRDNFGRAGPGRAPQPPGFPPDKTTSDVLRLVEDRFASHPGRLECFDWPVTPADAYRVLDDFIRHRLPRFGDFQDAMWTN